MAIAAADATLKAAQLKLWCAQRSCPSQQLAGHRLLAGRPEQLQADSITARMQSEAWCGWASVEVAADSERLLSVTPQAD